MVIWVIGMSGSGKTTIAQEMLSYLKQSKVHSRPWVFLDGDSFRQVMGEDLGHSRNDRYLNAVRMVNLCRFLDSQGVNVLACVLSIFKDTRDVLRAGVQDFRQLYIKVDYEVLKRRDNKELYLRAESGDIDDVVGVQIEFPEPLDSDYTLDNNIDGVSPGDLAKKALVGLECDVTPYYGYCDKNLLESPQKYQYTSYMGDEFISSYKVNRNDALKCLEVKISEYYKYMPTKKSVEKSNFDAFEIDVEIDGLSNDEVVSSLELELMPSDYSNKFLESNHEGCLVTRSFLLEQHKRMDECELQKERVYLLLKRFEVSKKIYTCYSGEDFKKISSDYSDVINYLLFHYLLVRLQEDSSPAERLILLNAALKLGDTIVSILPDMVTPGQMALAYFTLHHEAKLIDGVRND